MDKEKLRGAWAIARDLRRCANGALGDCDQCLYRDCLLDCCEQLKQDAAAALEAMAAALEACAGQPAPNTAVRLGLLNEIINLTSVHLNAHQQDIVQSLVYEASQGHTSDDPDTVAHSHELLQIARETPRSSLPGKIYQAIVLALVPVICPKSKEVEEN